MSADRHTTPAAGNSDAINQRFAVVQTWGVRLGLAVTAVAFTLYLAGVMPGYVDVQHLPGLLEHPAATYTAQNDIPTGWRWLAHLEHGDTFSLFALMLLVATVPAAFLALLPLLLRRRDWIYVALVVAQLAVFVLAGSGWLSGG